MTDFKVTKGDPLRAETWNSLVDRLPSEATGYGAALANINRVMVRVVNETGADLDLGDACRLDAYAGPTDNPYDIAAGLLVSAKSITFPDTITRAAFAAEPILQNEQGFAVVSGLAVVKVNSTAGSADWIFIDPDAATQCRVATGGFGKVAAIYDSSRVLAVIAERQNLWRAELLDEADSTTRSAKLLDLNDQEYAASITITDPDKALDTLKVGDKTFVLNTGSDFYSFVNALDCTAICEKCGIFANENGTCDPPPENGGCCDYSAVTPDDRCNYKSDAITSLVLDDGAGTVYTQNGESRFFEAFNFCRWVVPVLDQNGDQWEAFVERAEDGWIATGSGTPGTWTKQLGPTSCSGAVSGMTINGGGDGSFSYQDDGSCPDPPITACDEQLDGTLYPRVRVSGYPDSWTEIADPPIVWTEIGGVCDGTLYDDRTVDLSELNGTFLGPAFIENPGGGNLPPVPPTAFTTLCNEVQIVPVFRLNNAVQCTDPDVLCADEIVENHFWDWGGAFFFAPWGADSGDPGNCLVAGGSGVVDIPLPTCDPGGSWRDIQFTVSRRLRRIVNRNPLTWQCWQLTIEVDYVLL